ncbi:hypothetical protein K7X08_014812 [Anisodus acutangulus]|uniref:Uncharacterized protein n=1 Tax=Anisodus acutangulus TaxID=402998 RepID=A0A9Q1R3H3_9SOLA|nr:hypothetical protein K7X08_014812 [Anisodus acutangulus]
MENTEELSEGLTMMGKAEIDTRVPFRSVKEAVMLFGERVLAGELYSPNKLKQKMQDGSSEYESDDPSNNGTVTDDELIETKQRLERAREERLVMATCLSSLEEELERTRKELDKLKFEQQEVMVSEIDEDLKYIEKSQIMAHENIELQIKRYVTFANSPQGDEDVVLQRQPLKKKKKKIPLIIPLIGGIFSRKRGSNSDKIQSARV